MVGLAAVQAGAPEEEDQVAPEMASVLEQVPRSGWAWAGQGAAIAYGACGVIAAGGLVPGGLAPLLLAALVAAPCAAAASGYLSLRNLLHHGH